MAEQSTERPAAPGDSEATRHESMGLHARTETAPVREESPPPKSTEADAVPAVSEPLVDEAFNDPTLPRVPGTTATEAPKP